MTGDVRIALIGAGGIGKRWARVIGEKRGVKLAFVCDRDYAKAHEVARHFSGCVASGQWEECVMSNRVDAAVIAVPHVLLAPASRAFLNARKHVLCEKPGALIPSDVKKAMESARKNNVRYMIGFNHRYHAGFLKARELFDKGTIGDVLFIRARYGFGGREGYEKEWRFNKKISGGGELIDQGVHMIDLARWFLGDFKEVKGFAENIFWKSNVEDNAFLLLKNERKQIASIHVSWTQWNPLHVFEIYGTKGYLAVNGLGKKYGGGENLIVGVRDPNFKKALQERVIACDSDADHSLAKELKEFVSAIRQKRDPKPDGHDAYEALKIVQAMYEPKK